MSIRIAFVALATLGFAATADAAQIGAFTLAGSSAVAVTPVVNGYGPNPYGIYGSRHRHKGRRSYGTGYHGRGTATGGPVGGLPSRN